MNLKYIFLFVFLLVLFEFTYQATDVKVMTEDCKIKCSDTKKNCYRDCL